MKKPMDFQQLKEKINGWYNSKSPVERQKMVKYAVVFPAAVLSGIVILWLIFGTGSDGKTLIGSAFNTNLPEGEKTEVGTKTQEYQQADLAKQKEQNAAVVATLDTITTVEEDTIQQPTAIELSVSQYQEIQASIQDFYVPDASVQSAEVAALNERIAELEAQAAAVQSAPSEMELIQESYRMASQLMTGGQGQAIVVDEPSKDRKVQPVTQVNRNVVSSLSASSDRTFSTAVGGKRQNPRNTVAATVAGNQTVQDGQSVKLRTLEPMWIGHSLLPKNSPVIGKARLQGERLEIKIETIEVAGNIMEVELLVYDSDGQEGINIPNCLESDALKEIGANMGSTMGSSINLTTDVGAQLASDVGKGLINGVSQYLTKKIRTVKVHLKGGYRVMLYQPENN